MFILDLFIRNKAYLSLDEMFFMAKLHHKYGTDIFTGTVQELAKYMDVSVNKAIKIRDCLLRKKISSSDNGSYLLSHWIPGGNEKTNRGRPRKGISISPALLDYLETTNVLEIALLRTVELDILEQKLLNDFLFISLQELNARYAMWKSDKKSTQKQNKTTSNTSVNKLSSGRGYTIKADEQKIIMLLCIFALRQGANIFRSDLASMAQAVGISKQKLMYKLKQLNEKGLIVFNLTFPVNTGSLTQTSKPNSNPFVFVYILPMTLAYFVQYESLHYKTKKSINIYFLDMRDLERVRKFLVMCRRFEQHYQKISKKGEPSKTSVQLQRLSVQFDREAQVFLSYMGSDYVKMACRKLFQDVGGKDVAEGVFLGTNQLDVHLVLWALQLLSIPPSLFVSSGLLKNTSVCNSINAFLDANYPQLNEPILSNIADLLYAIVFSLALSFVNEVANMAADDFKKPRVDLTEAFIEEYIGDLFLLMYPTLRTSIALIKK